MKPTDIRKQITDARASKGFSMRRAAEIVGVTESTWSYWESGKRRPGGAARKMLAREFGIQF